MKLARYTRYVKRAAGTPGDSAGPAPRALPADSLCGPYGFDHDHELGLTLGEFVYFFPVAHGLTRRAGIAVTGAQNGSTRTFGPFDVDARLSGGNADLTGPAFGLAPGTYVGIVYRPRDLATARREPTSDTITVSVTDTKGITRTSARLSLTVPPVGIPASTTWGPHSPEPIDIGHLDAFTGATFLPTGEVVFDVQMGEHENVTVTQPCYGSVVAVPTDANTHLVQLVYTPYEQHRTDSAVYRDSFTFSIHDENGDVSVTTVPVAIPKLATVTPAGPYLGEGTFTGRLSAPLDDIAGYLVVPASLLAQSIAGVAGSDWYDGEMDCGSVTIDEGGVFAYTRKAPADDVPADAIDDSFAVIAYTPCNEWAVAMVPVGAAALTSYPSIVDVLTSVPTSPQDV
ncbi:hypothetical protein HZU40_14480 [Mycolicibacterium fluoranthenivorans]|uniref:Uncharacterized protein n=1 Tax=Mycolicibacterium fluoranthenivorans TaxID=258505 RepID=A0A7G8PLV6_9MYCO|nr:hypothetical protein [Mycolicibacterium fluoranthenivorans]QNJ95322.1 hypothetical protein HZU40_14480 [Mycolicibacterium fluoranthenivorans]